MKCECELSQFCERFKRHLNPTEHRICRGDAFDEKTTATYHTFWAQSAEAATERTEEQKRQDQFVADRERRQAEIEQEHRDRIEHHAEYAASCRWHGEFKRQQKCNVGCQGTGRGKLFDVFHCEHEEVIKQSNGECSSLPKHTKIQWCVDCDYHEKG